MCGQSESQWSYTNLWDQFPEYFPVKGLFCNFQFFGDNSYQSLGQKLKRLYLLIIAIYSDDCAHSVAKRR